MSSPCDSTFEGAVSLGDPGKRRPEKDLTSRVRKQAAPA